MKNLQEINVLYIIHLDESSTVSDHENVEGYLSTEYGNGKGKINPYIELATAKDVAEKRNATVEVMVKASCEKWVF